MYLLTGFILRGTMMYLPTGFILRGTMMYVPLGLYWEVLWCTYSLGLYWEVLWCTHHWVYIERYYDVPLQEKGKKSCSVELMRWREIFTQVKIKIGWFMVSWPTYIFLPTLNFLFLDSLFKVSLKNNHQNRKKRSLPAYLCFFHFFHHETMTNCFPLTVQWSMCACSA